MSHRSQILHGLLARAPKTRAAFGVSSQLYFKSVLDTRVHKREPHKKKIRKCSHSPSQPLPRCVRS